MTPNTNSEQWTYDNRGRVLTYAHSYNNSLKASVSYQYDEFGRLKKKLYDSGKVSEDFTWNLQGWNTGKQAKWGSSLIFSEDLKYYNPVKDTTLALYSGNISEAATKQQTGQLATNSYSYDGAGRLTNALLLLGDSQNPVTYNGMRNIQYDRNGSNLTTDMGFNKLQSFSHSGNRLTAIQESFPQSTRPSSSATFAYDSRGNMSSDGRKGLLISYNILNLPEKVVKTDSTDMVTFRYLYDGTKEEVPEGGLNLLDFGARYYDPELCRWTSVDPMAEKYYGVSPYGYCCGEPIHLIDPDGLAVWELKSDGSLSLIDSTITETIVKHYDKNGKESSIQLSGDGFLTGLKTRASNDGKIHYNKLDNNESNMSDALTFFFFAADNTDKEWAVHYDEQSIALGTKYSTDSVGNWSDFGFENVPTTSIHSHPNVENSDILESMGMSYSRGEYSGDDYKGRDFYNFLHDRTASRYFIYFPNSPIESRMITFRRVNETAKPYYYHKFKKYYSK